MTVENLSRRQLLRGKFLASLHSQAEQTQGFEGVRPPWAVANHDFIESCTRCGDCIQVCESKILIKGDGGFPEVDFDKGECTFCQKCAVVCEQPIFRELSQPAWAHKIEITAQCLTEHKIECRSCQDSCPMSAIRFRLQLGGVAKPVVNSDSCNGCGACIAACPVSAIKISKNISKDE